ncbi:O-antigen ligase family protein [Micromonospora echinaurantiaca]|uniref:O-antigen ligase family protein n=1 Tax=Micromonospora echinaurantiaca TaxID=47857 RepID=UPI0037A1BC29
MPSATREYRTYPMIGPDWPREASTPRHRQPGLPVTLLIALFIVALAGRFTLDRAGFSIYSGQDLRTPACLGLLGVTLVWHVSQTVRGQVQRWPWFFLIFSALIGVQMLAFLWAPFGARTDKALWDLLTLWILVLVTTALTAGDPQRAARVLLILMLVAGMAYAVAALAAGPQSQGRYSAFGGGPNVFVRVVAMGLIASIALAVLSRRWWLLLPLPLLGAAAVLSGSRGGLVALIGAATIFFVFFARRRASILLGTVLVGGLSAWLVWATVGERFASVAETRYSNAGIQSSDYSTRPELLSAAWSMFLEHPVAGAGLDSFYAAIGFGYPHNYLAAVAAETGLIGLGLLALAVCRWWWDGRPWSAISKEQIGCAVAAIYILLTSMFSGDYFDTRFFWILAVVAVQQPVFRSERRAQKQEVARW